MTEAKCLLRGTDWIFKYTFQIHFTILQKFNPLKTQKVGFKFEILFIILEFISLFKIT